jgi:hypothetical protein
MMPIWWEDARMYSDEDAALFELLICATRDLAARCEQPGEQQEQEQEQEQENVKTLLRIAGSLGLHALLLSGEEHRDVVADCAVRLQETAQEQGVSYAVDFADRTDDSELAVTWRELQIAVDAHDKACDTDSQPLAPQEQMMRHTIRLATVSGSIVDGEEFWSALADLLLLAVRLRSAAGEELPDRPIPRNDSQIDSALGDPESPYCRL